MSNKLNNAVASIKTLNATIDKLEAELAASQKWRSVALALGESWGTHGAAGYYDMTPEQWLEWMNETLEKREWDAQ